MWRNLAKVQSTIQTIGNVVAPALSSDEEDEEGSFYQERYEGEDNEEAVEFTHGFTEPQPLINATPLRRGGDSDGPHDSLTPLDASLPLRNLSDAFTGVGAGVEDSDEEDGSHPAAQHQGFGFVGFLAKALNGAGANESSDESEVNAYHGDRDCGENVKHRGYQNEEEDQIPTDVGQSRDADDLSQTLFAGHGPGPGPVARTTVPSHRLEPDMSSPAKQELEIDGPVVFAGATSDTGRFTPDAMAPVDPLASTSEHNPMGLVNTNQLPEPRRFGLIREQGSVSPFGSPSSIRSTSIRSNSSTAINATSAGQGTVSGLPPTREDDASDNARNEPLKVTSDKSWVSSRSGSASLKGMVDDDDPTKSRADATAQHMVATTSIPPPTLGTANAAGGFSEPSNPHAFGDDVSRNLSSQSPLAANEPGPMPSDIRAGTLGRRKESARSASRRKHPPVVSNDSNNHSPTEVQIRRPPPTHESKLNPPREPPSIPCPPFAASTSFDHAGADHAVMSANAEGAERHHQQKQQWLLEVQYKELEDKLKQAEAKIQVLEHAATLNVLTPVHDERSQLDELRVEFQEKEARIMAAAAEDHEQELRFLQSDMEVKVQSLQQEMAQERDVFEREREYFEQLVAEANARAEQTERQFQRERTKQESAIAQYQKQHERELQMKAEKLAESMALLDEREDQVAKLKAMVQTLQSKLSEHAEGAQLAEDEVDELHHENEDLRNAVEKFETLCRDLQKKNMELQSDSNKLSELRVSTVFVS
jgi:hypothetical protein